MSKLDLKKIRLDGGTQPREEIDEQLVSEYSDDMQEGDVFPPVDIYNDGANYWLADGFHRYHATKKTGFLEINANIIDGTKREAILHSVGVNGKHGKRRTNADKRKAVKTLLEDEEWGQWSDNEIAKQAEVSQPFVSKLRSSYNDYKIGDKKKVKRGDQEYTVDTSNIGNKSKDIPDNVDSETGEVLDETDDSEFKTYFKESKKSSNNKMGFERQGIGLEKAHEAINKLKEIPPNDGLKADAYKTVIQWINDNR